MKKSFSFFTAAAILLYAAAGHTRICFLADTSCQEAGFAGSNECSSDPSSKKCPTKKKYSSYYDSCGVHYRDDGCLDGYCDINKLGISPDKYNFSNDKCDECFKGATCKLKNKCDPEKHINSPENPFGDVCFAITSDCQIDKETAFYSNCVCLSEYNIEENKCTGDGLKASDCCDDTAKGKLCKSCVCADGWQSQPTCDYGVEDQVTNPAGGTCYKCKTKPNCEVGEQYVSTKNYSCSGANQTAKFRSSGSGWCASCVCKGRTSDFDSFWKKYYAEPGKATPPATCAMGQGKIEYDCVKLGYNMQAASGTKCSDGTEPYRCPFNHEKVYCASGLGDDPKPTETCPEGYSTAYPNVNACGLSADWTWSSSGSVNGAVCGKCTKKPYDCKAKQTSFQSFSKKYFYVLCSSRSFCEKENKAGWFYGSFVSVFGFLGTDGVKTNASDFPPGDQGQYGICGREMIAQCLAASRAFSEALAEHNNKCPNNKVDGAPMFACYEYVDDEGHFRCESNSLNRDLR